MKQFNYHSCRKSANLTGLTLQMEDVQQILGYIILYIAQKNVISHC